MVRKVIVVNLIDKNISHVNCYDDGLEKGRTPKKISYVRNQISFNGITIFTDDCLRQVNSVESTHKVAWIMEPRSYAPNSYYLLESLIDKFDLILTFDSHLLSNYPDKTKRIPADGIFLDSESIFSNTPKTKCCSIIYSNKTFLPGHALRHEIAKSIIDNQQNIDRFGSGTGVYLEKKSDALREYRFSISIENSKDEFYITEKIFDCFATRTIPIYWGSNRVLKEFNSDGILMFDTLSDLNGTISQLSDSFYESKISAVEENYRLALKHYSVDDHIADALSSLIRE
jgi:hypothetical protein